MNWNRVHHWHLGLVGGIISGVVALFQMGFQNLGNSAWATYVAGVFMVWAVDDALYHHLGLKTPCYWLEQTLTKVPLYRRISKWIKKRFK